MCVCVCVIVCVCVVTLSTILNTSLKYSICSVQLHPLPSDDLEEDFGDDLIFSGEDEVDSEAAEETKV